MDVTIKPTTANVNKRTSPNRRLRKPVIGIDIALAAPNAVITHIPWSVDMPKLPAIVGMATLAIDVSKTIIKVAIDVARVINKRRIPLTGAKSFILSPHYKVI
ncbi:hypothetical protein P3TCK_02336 [Photobacterium profundum 3TCK]|uniref:Uncharacterized protein n=1 Tax=Photobacterium profundum 3TCK TaxID=314280 RepID=Q1YXA0_9GAMM|nr:hypothetical protein P3TCK_02336 [Photobacterium profundum 3TCK]